MSSVEQEIEAGLHDVEAGRTIAHEQLEDELPGDAHRAGAQCPR